MASVSQLHTARVSMGRRCDKCGRPTEFVFYGVQTGRWQRRCRRCAERMVTDGKAKWPRLEVWGNQSGG